MSATEGRPGDQAEDGDIHGGRFGRREENHTPRGAETSPPVPSLPQSDDAATGARRKYELSLARTAYNYTTSHLYPAPLSAQVPKGGDRVSNRLAQHV